MSHHPQKDKTTVRYLVTETRECIQVATIEQADKFDLTASAKDLLDKGYEILESDLPKKREQALEARIYTVYLRERVTVVFPHQPKEAGQPVDGLAALKWPKGLTETDLRQTRSRVINYTFEDGSQAAEPVRDEVVFERNALVNHVSNLVTYTEWQPVDEPVFDQVTSPELTGYTADRALVDALEEVSFEDEAVREETVVYAKEKQEAILRVVDADGQELFTDTISGATNDPVVYDSESLIDRYLAQGYDILANPFEDECFFGDKADEQEVFTIEVGPRLVNLSLEALPTAGQPVYSEYKDSVLWPKGVERKKLQRTVVRTIVSQHEDGEVINQIEQVVEFQRPASVDLLNQEVIYDDWQVVSEASSFPAYTPESLEGYSPRPRQIPALTTVTPDSVNLLETIVYAKKIQRVNIQFLDASNDQALLYEEQLVGKTGEPLRASYRKKMQEFINNGYEIVDNTIPAEARFSADDQSIKDYTISLAPKVLTVSPDQPRQAGSYIDAEAKSGPKWPIGVDEASLKRLITRTVYHCFENGKEALDPHVSGILFERSADINLVTGQVTYTDWTADKDSFEAYEAPELAGYYTTKSQVPVMAGIAVDSADFDTVIHYIKSTNQLAYTILDTTTDTVLETNVINGRSVQTLKDNIDRRLVPYLAKGYQLVDDNRLTLALKNPDLDKLTIELVQVEETVAADQPRQAHHLVTGYNQVSWPKGLDQASLTKTVTRTVRFVDDKGKSVSSDVEQALTFTRQATANLVTGQVTYGDWEPAEQTFPALDLPVIEGYLTTETQLAEQAVFAESLSEEVSVTYYPEVSQVTVSYQDARTGEVIFEDMISGQVGDQVPYSFQDKLAAKGLLAYDVVDQDCPAEIRFVKEPLSYTIKLQSKTLTISSADPKLPHTATLLEGYGLFTWPAGLEKSALSGQISRRVRFQDQEGKLLRQPLEQAITLNRNATVDLVSREVTYSKWLATDQMFDAVVVPEIEGYQAEPAQLPAMEVTDFDAAVGGVVDDVVIYYPLAYQAQLNFVNKRDQALLRQVDLLVSDKEEATEALEQHLAWYQTQGYTTVSNDFDLDKWIRGRLQEATIVLEPQLLTVSLEQVQSKFQSFDEDVAAQLQVLEGLTSLNLSRQVVRTINYHHTNGQVVAPSHSDQVTFKRTARVNLVTNEVFYDEWESYYPTFDEVLSPVCEGHTPSKEIVEAIDAVDADSPNITETIIYTRNIQQVVVNVIDKSTGNIIYAESITDTNGDYTSSSKISQFVKKGQEVVSSPVPVLEADEPTASEDLVGQEDAATIQLASTEESVDSSSDSEKIALNSPANPRLLSAADEQALKAYKLNPEDLERHLVREIRYQFSDGSQAAETVYQTLTYERQASVVGDEVSLSDWAPEVATFAELASPVVDGYVADITLAEEEVVQPDAEQRRVLVVTYVKAKTENVTIVFTEKETGGELLTFNFANKGREFSEKKIKKGVSFLKYKGYTVVESNYPEKGELVGDDTMLYHVYLTKQDDQEPVVQDKAAEQINKKVQAEEFSQKQKQKGFFERLFKE